MKFLEINKIIDTNVQDIPQEKTIQSKHDKWKENWNMFQTQQRKKNRIKNIKRQKSASIVHF